MKIQIKRVKFIPLGKWMVRTDYVAKRIDEPSQDRCMWTRNSAVALRILAGKNALFNPATTFVPICVQDGMVAPPNAERRTFDGDAYWEVPR